MLVRDRVISAQPISPTLQEGLCEIVQGNDIRSILDIGAGNGRVGSAMLELEPYADIVSLDADERLVLKGFRQAQHLNFMQGEVRDLDFDDGSFDAVTAVNVLHEVADGQVTQNTKSTLSQAASEISRVLRLGGKLLVFDGFMPTQEAGVTLTAKDKLSNGLLSKFVNEYVARPPDIKETYPESQTWISDIASLMTFVTKYGYLRDESTWQAERLQLYPFAYLSRVTNVFRNNDLSVDSVRHIKPEERLGLRNVLRDFSIDIADQSIDQSDFPHCQTMITATKVRST